MSILSHGTPDSSSGEALAVTPHDSTNMVGKCRYLYVGTAGDPTIGLGARGATGRLR